MMVEGHCIRTIHAEIQAIARLRGEFESLTAYITAMPCVNCYKALVAVNVKEIHTAGLYIDTNRDKLVEFYGVPIENHQIDPEIWKKTEDILGL